MSFLRLVSAPAFAYSRGSPFREHQAGSSAALQAPGHEQPGFSWMANTSRGRLHRRCNCIKFKLTPCSLPLAGLRAEEMQSVAWHSLPALHRKLGRMRPRWIWSSSPRRSISASGGTRVLNDVKHARTVLASGRCAVSCGSCRTSQGWKPGSYGPGRAHAQTCYSWRCAERPLARGGASALAMPQ